MHDPTDDFDDDEDAFSLEELGEAYKHIVSQSDDEGDGGNLPTGEVLQRDHLVAAQAKAEAERIAAVEAAREDDPGGQAIDDPGDEFNDIVPINEPDVTATPHAIIEATLFVGQPSGDSLSAVRLASIIRNMSVDEVTEIIDSLNTSYRTERQGIRIVHDDTGYRMVVAPEAESMRHVFTGKVRETRLNQASIEVLSLVAYQPGITSQQCTDLRGRDSGPLLNQLVRRRLIEMKREPEHAAVETESIRDAKPIKNEAKVKMVSRFFPAERLLVLLGLESLEDLPQVEESHLE